MALIHADAGEKVRLGPLGSAIKTTRTHALVKTGRFEAVQLVLPRGASIPAHSVTGQISLYCIEGAVELETDRLIEMQAGDWLYLSGGEKHALKALEDCSLLLTILFD